MIDIDKYEEIRQVFLDGIIDTQDAEDYDVTDCWYRKQLMILDDLLAEVKRLSEELNRAYDTIQEYEEVIEPKRLNKIERLEKALKSNGRYNAIVDATGNAGRGSIMVDVTFDDGEEYYGILDKVIE
tara:strand:+ start:345 stop:725 length:381 start_codon:yes stop_codon:yes gene_type:complete